MDGQKFIQLAALRAFPSACHTKSMLRASSSLAWGIALVTALASVACGGAEVDGDGDTSSALESLPTGMSEDSPEAIGVRMLANDRRVGVDLLITRASLSPTAAKGIVAARTGPGGVQRWFRSAADVLSLPTVGTDDIARLAKDAAQNGYVEKPGFDAPDQVRLRLAHPTAAPKESDIVIDAGFDGQSPDAVLALVRSRLTNTVDQDNDSFVTDTIRSAHKAFTIAAFNLLGPSTPPGKFAANLHASSLTLLGTVSAVHPTILVAETAGQKTYYTRGEGGSYVKMNEVPKYPILMTAKLRLAPAVGIRVFYPEWSAKVLREPTGTVIEGS